MRTVIEQARESANRETAETREIIQGNPTKADGFINVTDWESLPKNVVNVSINVLDFGVVAGNSIDYLDPDGNQVFGETFIVIGSTIPVGNSNEELASNISDYLTLQGVNHTYEPNTTSVIIHFAVEDNGFKVTYSNTDDNQGIELFGSNGSTFTEYVISGGRGSAEISAFNFPIYARDENETDETFNFLAEESNRKTAQNIAIKIHNHLVAMEYDLFDVEVNRDVDDLPENGYINIRAKEAGSQYSFTLSLAQHQSVGVPIGVSISAESANGSNGESRETA